jgi:hypothetical protein
MLLLLFLTILTLPLETYAQPKKCPNIDELASTSLKDRSELLNALKTIVLQTYGSGEFGQAHKELYSKWDTITALPFPKTVGRERNTKLLWDG